MKLLYVYFHYLLFLFEFKLFSTSPENDFNQFMNGQTQAESEDVANYIRTDNVMCPDIHKKNDEYLRKTSNLNKMIKKIKNLRKKTSSQRHSIFAKNNIVDKFQLSFESDELSDIKPTDPSLNRCMATSNTFVGKGSKNNFTNIFQQTGTKNSSYSKYTLPNEYYKGFFDVESWFSTNELHNCINESIELLALPLKLKSKHQMVSEKTDGNFNKKNNSIIDNDEYIINLFFEMDGTEHGSANLLSPIDKNQSTYVKLNWFAEEKQPGDKSCELIWKKINLKKEYLALTFIIPESIYIFTQFLNKENIQNFVKKNHEISKIISIIERFEDFKTKYRSCLSSISSLIENMKKKENYETETIMKSGIFVFKSLLECSEYRKITMDSYINPIRAYLHDFFDYLMDSPPLYPQYREFQRIMILDDSYYGLHKHFNFFARYLENYEPFSKNLLDEYLQVLSALKHKPEEFESAQLKHKHEELKKKLRNKFHAFYAKKEIIRDLSEFLILFENNILKSEEFLKEDFYDENDKKYSNDDFSAEKKKNQNKKFEKYCKIGDYKKKSGYIDQYFAYLNYLVLKGFFNKY